MRIKLKGVRTGINELGFPLTTLCYCNNLPKCCICLRKLIENEFVWFNQSEKKFFCFTCDENSLTFGSRFPVLLKVFTNEKS